ncbi:MULTISPECIES: hypothetical protein [Brucella/Ochrobactrum group]|jgi:hypothetical protein|uniref:Uncharacterized protein n=4 Tax=Brucella TaxID=234 RepID=A6X4V8_BRUA4|nr:MULTISPECIES: hypothetical protein [Brucella/Ochrobactrum group]MCR5941930.1 hypothetical protein [Ochrobactrum sp. XJ1]QOD65449.1 hypothetical protein HGK82_20260 [Ochrobactrum sp. MT180101]QTN05012.1 hypothetical protein GTN27_17605 [Ochrobactrum sp. EEELCW01]RNL46232.1 hypothetical protein D7I41_03600 [Ochrobactrum sp. MH181795]ABS16262.1 hypothetical protein Oant_3556 [Brucella anthropi ATCC 49188]
MKSIIIGPAATEKDRTVTQQILLRIHEQMPKPSEDKTQVCNVLRLSKGGYSHRRRRIHKLA